MKKRTIGAIFSVIILFLLLPVIGTKSYAVTAPGTTVSGGVDYSAVYNYDYYVNTYPDIKQAFGGNDAATLNHFITYGMTEGRQGIATFNVRSYKLAYPDLREAFGSNLKAYYLHYMNYGRYEGRKATGVTQLVGAVTQLGGVDYSAVYNYDYYIAHNPDVAQAFNGDDIATLNHFITYGMAEGRQGIETFNVRSYKLAYPDLRGAFGSNLKAYYLHYMNYGRYEGRKATGVTQLVGTTTAGGVDYSAVYNYDYYIAHHPDVYQAFNGNDVAILNHFITYGMSEGRQAIETFNVRSYKLAYPDLREAFGGNLKAYYLHYMNNGRHEGRKATGVTQLVGTTTAGGIDYSAVYNYDYYIAHHPDVYQAFNGNDVAILNHFIVNGMSEGRQAIANFNVRYYKCNYPDLQLAFGNSLKSYYLHYINYGRNEQRDASSLVHDYTGWWDNYGSKYYYENGSMCTGWKTIAGRNYYFSNTGVLSSRTGVDVSSWQGKIDWQAVKNDGIEFAIIRVGYGNDQPDQDDTTAAYNISECERLGIPYGVYFFCYAMNNDEAQSEANHLLRLLNGRHPSLGVYYDVEGNSWWTNNNFDPYANKAAINNFCAIVLTAVKNAGYKPGIYSNFNYLNNIIDNNFLINNELWLAYFTPTDYPSNKWDIWQYTSDGSVAGISTRADMDVIKN